MKKVKNKNYDFDPIKIPLFFEQCELILVYSGSSRRDLQESYPMSHSTLHTDIMTPLYTN
jgi:hypothetical protein